MSASPKNPELEAFRQAVREAIERAGCNVELHIERDVYEKGTARAVVQEFTEQLLPVLKEGGRS